MGTAARLERHGAAASPVRVLIVDDSIVARAVMRRIVESDPRYAVAGALPGAAAALAFLADHAVDIVLLDVEMPGTNGLSALPAIIAAARGAPVMIVSTLCDAGAQASVHALSLGAADTLVKPGSGAPAGQFEAVLIERLERLVQDHSAETARPGAALPQASSRRVPPRLIAIGASTGGIHALSRMLRELDDACAAPILVTQHLPASFMPYFADQLAQITGRPCHVAEDRMRIRTGHIYVAPGDAHLLCTSTTDGHSIRLDRGLAVSGCLPSADPMFESVGAAFGVGALAIVLSGMGRDGAAGAQRLVSAGGGLIAQDRESSVVWGMPGAVVNAGLAEATLPPEAIGRLVRHRCGGRP